MDIDYNKESIKGLADVVKDLSEACSSGTFGLGYIAFTQQGTSSSEKDNITDSDKLETCGSCCECELNKCHGCDGKGWIENSLFETKLCPVCQGKGKLDKTITHHYIPLHQPDFTTSEDERPYDYYITCYV